VNARIDMPSSAAQLPESQTIMTMLPHPLFILTKVARSSHCAHDHLLDRVTYLRQAQRGRSNGAINRVRKYVSQFQEGAGLDFPVTPCFGIFE
jgi:hypothetical protein